MSAAPERLPVAVLGVGHLGSRHADRLSRSPRFELRSVFDIRPHQTRAVAAAAGCAAARSLDEALEDVRAVVVATSTESHHEVAGAALAAGRHVLVEKPLTGRVDEAAELASAAAEKGLVLHVGHVERFNPALRGLLGEIGTPLFVESHRLAPLVPRSLDIDVIQDLMIHDIDLALAFIGSEPESVQASGVAVLTGRVDIANARLTFPGGITANLTASRVSLDRTRKFRMFLRGTYISADCVTGTGHVYRLKDDRESVLAEALASGGGPLDMLRVLDHRTVGPAGEDALDAEHGAFHRAVAGEPSEGVTGRDVIGVLRTMVKIEEAIRRTAEDG